MTLDAIEAAHASYILDRRRKVLASILAPLVSHGSRVLDVGCGDGAIGRAIGDLAGSHVEGVDTLVRPGCAIPVQRFDGRKVPYAGQSFDVALLVDAVHHAADGVALLRECARVASKAVVIKDHLREGFLARQTLAFMDRVGNERHAVASPGHYWSTREWHEAFAAVGLELRQWTTDLRL